MLLLHKSLTAGHLGFNIYKNKIKYIFLQGFWDANTLGIQSPQRWASTSEWVHGSYYSYDLPETPPVT